MGIPQSLVVKIYDTIKPHLIKLPDGCWEYESGWSDGYAAQQIGNYLTAQHIARVRAKIIGPLREACVKAITHSSRGELATQLARIEAKLDHLIHEVGAKAWQPLNGPVKE